MRSRPTLLVMDGMGVIYAALDDVAELLIPFARDHGSTSSDAEIAAMYTECSLGVYPSSVHWQGLGVAGDGAELDELYLKGHRVTPGIRALLEAVRRRSVQVACLSNDVANWSIGLRRMHGLDRLIEHWCISAEVGVRKPATAIYDVLLDRTKLLPGQCLFVDDRLPNVRAARNRGFRTLWLVDEVQKIRSPGIPQINSIDEIADYL